MPVISTPITVASGTTGLDLMQMLVPRLGRITPVMSLVMACNAIISSLDRRLMQYHSDLLRVLATVVTSATGSFALPPRFRGFCSEPVVNGRKLYPLGGNPELWVGQGATPNYYLIQGTAGQLYPKPTAAVSINLDYWQGLAPVNSETDSLPLYDYFPQVYQEAVIRLLAGSLVATTREFETYMQQEVDGLLLLRARTPNRPALCVSYF